MEQQATSFQSNLLTFAPDKVDFSKNAVVECNALKPTKRGLETIPDHVFSNFPVKTGLMGVYTARYNNGSKEYFFFDYKGSIFEFKSNTYTLRHDQEDEGGVWTTFCQFGDVVLACSKSSGLLKKHKDESIFSKITAAPDMDMIASLGGLIVGFKGNEWHTSALYDYTDWTPSISTQAANGQLIQTQGNVIAAVNIQDKLLVFKEKSIYLCSYIGSPYVLQWDVVSYSFGVAGYSSYVSTPKGIFFVSNNNFYIFDGVSFLIVENNVKEFFFSRIYLLNSEQQQVKCYYDEDKNNVHILYSVPLYHVETIFLNIDSMNFGLIGYELIGFPAKFAQYTSHGEKMFFYNSMIAGGVHGSISELKGSSPLPAALTTGVMGENKNRLMLKGFNLNLSRRESGDISAKVLYSDKEKGFVEDIDNQVQMVADDTSQFHLMRSFRFFRIKVDIGANCELINLKLEVKPKGRR